MSWLPAAHVGEGNRSTSGHCGPRWSWLRAGCCRGDSLNKPALARLVQSKEKKTSPPAQPPGWRRVRSASICVRPGWRFLAPLVVCSRFSGLLPLRRRESGSPGAPKNPPPHPDPPTPGSSEPAPQRPQPPGVRCGASALRGQPWPPWLWARPGHGQARCSPRNAGSECPPCPGGQGWGSRTRQLIQ